MPKVLYHQDPQPVILDLVDHQIEEDKANKIKARKTKALVDADGNVVVTDPKEGTEFGQYTTEGQAVKAAEEAAAKSKK